MAKIPKSLMTCAGALLLSLSAAASDSESNERNAMKLWLQNNKQITFLLDDQPVLSFEGSDLTVKTHLNNFSYDSADIKKYTIEYVDPSGISGVTGSIVFSIENGALVACNLPASSPVSIYSVDGKLLKTQTTDRNGHIRIPLENIGSSVVLVKTSIANFKITRP